MNTPQELPESTFAAGGAPSKAEQVIDYITQMLAELSEMASDVGHDELAELIRFSGRAARMERSGR